MRAGSLFSGIGAGDLGLERAGFEIAWQAEIDPFCSKVLAKHWPGVPNYGDVRSVGSRRPQPDGQSRAVSHSGAGAALRCDPDLIIGGFPCQDVSVAGKRAGLDGERSGLWFEFHRILSELRPAFCLIENVPGLFSSNSGRDFGIVLGGLDELGYVVGWAVLDSQHFGVPQRRRRVYIVGGPTRASVQQILSLCEGGDWHPPAGREAREDVAYALSASVRKTGDGHGNAWNSNYVPEVAYALNAHGGPHGRIDVAHSLRAEGFDTSEDGTGRGTPIISVRTAQAGSNGWGIDESDTAYTLDGANGQAVAGASVRRLTPVECERLQGLPDGWTDLGNTADGPRYRALGNAMTMPVIEYLGLRVLELSR